MASRQTNMVAGHQNLLAMAMGSNSTGRSWYPNECVWLIGVAITGRWQDGGEWTTLLHRTIIGL